MINGLRLHPLGVWVYGMVIAKSQVVNIREFYVTTNNRKNTCFALGISSFKVFCTPTGTEFAVSEYRYS
ncbi:hypothetical protein LCGC14_2769440 [marine sediment metagenome]|uniref:Uncharacterized protein n=1 Tax=marine sediment metagenome TaxID=412755 RepID=A0A0F8YWL7_9ZZZZ